MDSQAPQLPEEVLSRLQQIYQELDAEIRATGVVCNASGNCCDFDVESHRVFATTLELRNLLRYRVPESGEFKGALCPYWKERKCTARDARPLGCRVYHCDTSYKERWAEELYNRYHKRLEELAAEISDGSHAYLPMVSGLRRFVEEGRFYDPDRPWSEFEAESSGLSESS